MSGGLPSTVHPFPGILDPRVGEDPHLGPARRRCRPNRAPEPTLITDDRHPFDVGGKPGGKRQMGAERGGFQQADLLDEQEQPERPVTEDHFAGASGHVGRIGATFPTGPDLEHEDGPRALLHQLDDRQPSASLQKSACIRVRLHSGALRCSSSP